MKENAPDHRKMKRLARLLKVPLPYANGIMERLWHHAGKYIPDGGIGRLSDEDIAEACGMPVEVDCIAFVKSLEDSGFLDPLQSCRYFIHDWPVHCTHYIHNRLANHQQFFADGSQPNLSRLQGDKRKQLALDFYRKPVSAETAPVSAETAPVSAETAPVSAHTPQKNAHTEKPNPTNGVGMSAHTPPKNAHGPANTRARPTPTPTPTPTPKKVQPLRESNVQTPNDTAAAALSLNGANGFHWKIAAAAAQRRFPRCGDDLVAEIAELSLNVLREVGSPIEILTDEVLADAIAEATTPTQRSAALYRTTVPVVIRNWAKPKGIK